MANISGIPLTTYEGLMEKVSQSSNLNIIVSVTRSCVLQCRYCYAIDPERLPPKRVLPIDLVEKLIHDAFDVRHRHLTFEWTGGEALLAGQKFYEKILEFQKRHARGEKTYSNCIQTSGGLYNEAFFDFLIDNRFRISVTIDGPRDLHEAQRPTRGGHSSFDTVLKSYAYIKKKQGECGVLCTLTKNSLGRAKEILSFYKGIGVKSWHSNTYVYDGAKPIQEKDIAMNPKDYAQFFKNQFDTWLELDDTNLKAGYIQMLMEGIAGILGPTICTHGGRCLTNFINIDDVGNASFCPKFLGYEEFQLGNIKEATVVEMLSPSNPVMKRLLEQRLESMHGCEREGCEYIPVCNSGCPYDSFLNGTDGSIAHRDRLCAGKRALYSHIEKRLQANGMKTMNSKTENKKGETHYENHPCQTDGPCL